MFIQRNKSYFVAFMMIMVFALAIAFGGGKRVVAQIEESLNDFETSLESASGGYFRPYHPTDIPPNQVITLDAATAAIGNQSCKSSNMLQTFHIWYIQNVNAKNFIDEAHNGGFDRFSFYLKIPGDYPLQPDRNCNLGTYTTDPSNSEPLYHDGHHYYHFFNIKGSEYWSKCVFNQHPRHRSGVGSTDPGVNPETWNYYDGFTRFYVQLLPYPDPPLPITLPFDVWIDNLKFYHSAEPENDDNISSIICTYEGDGQFWMSWRGNHYYDAIDPASTNPHEYRVYYASSLLTNANYNTIGTEVPGGPFQKETGNGIYDYNTTGSFNTGITSGEIYFAIKDISDSSVVVSKIDYHISETTDLIPPVLSNPQPTATLASGTSHTSISLTTNEDATCKYGTLVSVPYDEIAGTFISTGGTTHSTNVSGLSNGNNYTYYVRCRDLADNTNTDDFEINFSVAAAAVDTTAPVRSNGSPTGELDAGTIAADISLTTDEDAVCRYGTLASVSYDDLPNDFFSTGGTNHLTPISGLENGATYHLYVKCRDGLENTNTDDFEITFNVANTQSVNSNTSSKGGGSCFIATAAYGTPMAEEVKILSRFRDKHLLNNFYGKTFVNLYYKYSPKMADYIRQEESLKAIVRIMLKTLVNITK